MSNDINPTPTPTPTPTPSPQPAPSPTPSPTPDGGAPDEAPQPDTRNYGRSESLGTDYTPTEAQSGTQTPPEADTEVGA